MGCSSGDRLAAHSTGNGDNNAAELWFLHFWGCQLFFWLAPVLNTTMVFSTTKEIPCGLQLRRLCWQLTAQGIEPGTLALSYSMPGRALLVPPSRAAHRHHMADLAPDLFKQPDPSLGRCLLSRGTPLRI